ncbi:MAG: hypothetical protein HY236_13900 [Acidobacteria bacterium]|nr:hypothetical protein [Acidobacteriota bacterium]
MYWLLSLWILTGPGGAAELKPRTPEQSAIRVFDLARKTQIAKYGLRKAAGKPPAPLAAPGPADRRSYDSGYRRFIEVLPLAVVKEALEKPKLVAGSFSEEYAGAGSRPVEWGDMLPRGPPGEERFRPVRTG